MKVILLKELQGKGGEGDVIDVNRGFANNFLLTQGYAVKATPGNLKQLEERKKNIAKREETRIADANAPGREAERRYGARYRPGGRRGRALRFRHCSSGGRRHRRAARHRDRSSSCGTGQAHQDDRYLPGAVSLYRDIKGTVTVIVAGESEAEEAIDAIKEAIDIAETPADEMVEVDGEVAADGTVEVEVTETEE